MDLRNLQRWLVALGLLLWLLPAPAAAAGGLGAWSYSRRISVSGTAHYVRVAIPANVAAASRPDLADLRLADEAGQEAPYVALPGPALLFYRAPGHEYRLLYANPSATPPAYGVSFAPDAAADPGVLGNQEANPFFAGGDLRRQTWPRRYPIPFYTLAGGVLLLLAVYMYRRVAVRLRRATRPGS